MIRSSLMQSVWSGSIRPVSHDTVLDAGLTLDDSVDKF